MQLLIIFLFCVLSSSLQVIINNHNNKVYLKSSHELNIYIIEDSIC